MSYGGGSGTEVEETRYLPEQVCEFIEAMTDADLDAVEKASFYFAGRSSMSPEDLQQEALGLVRK